METLPVVSFINVSLKLNNIHILKNVSFTVNSGELFVIYGQSGSGKSSVLRLCLGLDNPTSGTVNVDGINVSTLSLPEKEKLRSRLGYVFQNGALLNNLTLEDNVALPLRYHTQLSESEIIELVEQKMAVANLVALRKQFPPSVSYDIRKLTGLVRGLVLEPKIMFYDEPLEGLDAHSLNTMMGLIRRIAGKGEVANIITTDSLNCVYTLGKRVLVLDEGQVKAVGNLAEIKPILETME